MAELTSQEIFQLYGASVAIRRAARTLDFAEFTLENAKAEALEVLGGNAATLDGTAVGSYRNDAAPLGRLDKLDLMQKQVNNLVAAALARSGR